MNKLLIICLHQNLKLNFCYVFFQSLLQIFWTLILRLDFIYWRTGNVSPTNENKKHENATVETSWRENMIDWFLIKLFCSFKNIENFLALFCHRNHSILFVKRSAMCFKSKAKTSVEKKKQKLFLCGTDCWLLHDSALLLDANYFMFMAAMFYD